MCAMALPVIVGMGGINAAGRTSGAQAYQSMVRSALSAAQRQQNIQAMAILMGLDPAQEEQIALGSMIRAIPKSVFDADAVDWNATFEAAGSDGDFELSIRTKRVPDPLPAGWQVVDTQSDRTRVRIAAGQELLVPAKRDFPVKTAGMLPQGFDPAALYPSRNHPKGLQMSLFAASDALGDSGLDWVSLQQLVGANQVSVYVGSAMGQLDYEGGGGMLSARARGGRVTSKHCPLSLAEMPADFINAYVLGHVGRTGAALGACASFLYNLRMGIDDIQTGRSHIAFVGGADAPVVPEVMDGYASMGALATADGMAAIDGVSRDQLDMRSMCRPFGENCGFTIGESAQVFMLMSDELALKVGAKVYGSAPLVEVCADGFKKSISGPGAGNYVTVAKVAAEARALLGDVSLKQRGLVQAHGTSTPQNRVTEGLILSRVANAFGIERWPVAAIKTYLGHSLGAASADQLAATLGVWGHGIIPGIIHTKSVAQDVAQSGLDFVLKHREVQPDSIDYSILNSKGFGGNNASALVLSPERTRAIMAKRAGSEAWRGYQARNETVAAQSQSYDAEMSQALKPTRYLFDHNVATDADVSLTDTGLAIEGVGAVHFQSTLGDYKV